MVNKLLTFLFDTIILIIGIIGKNGTAEIQKAAAELGGTAIPGKADMTVRFSFPPNFPLVLNLLCKIFIGTFVTERVSAPDDGAEP